MHQYYWAVSLAWLCSAVHCPPSRVRRDSAIYIPSLPSGGVMTELEAGSTSALPPPPATDGLLPLFSKVLEQSRADTHVVLVQISRILLE